MSLQLSGTVMRNSSKIYSSEGGKFFTLMNKQFFFFFLLFIWMYNCMQN